MGNIKSSLQECVELDDSVVSLAAETPYGYKQKFILVGRRLYLLLDGWTIEHGKYIITLKTGTYESNLECKLFDSKGMETPVSLEEIKGSGSYLLSPHPNLREGRYTFLMNYGEKCVCRINVYCERLKKNDNDEQLAAAIDSEPVEDKKVLANGSAGTEGGLLVHSVTFPDSKRLVSNDPFPSFIQDGPQFRTQLATWESTLFVLRSYLKTLYKRSAKLKELLYLTSKAFSGVSDAFSDIHDLLKDHPLSSSYMDIILASSTLCISQSRRLSYKASITHEELLRPLQEYLNTIDLKTITNNKKLYHDQAKEYYSYVGKHLSQRTDSALLPKRVQFELQRYDYFYSLLNYIMGSHSRDFAVMLAKFQMYIDPIKKPTIIQLARLYRANYPKFIKLTTEERERLSNVNNYSDLNDFYHLSTDNTSSTPLKEGLLWSYRNNGWHKQWVVLQGSQLSEYSDWKTEAKVRSRPSVSLTFACVKRSAKKPNGFDIITTNSEARSFQAESEDEMKQWLQVLQSAVGVMNIEDSDETRDPLTIVRNTDPSNSTCCDCHSDKLVEWISLNLLCVVCINCSGVHRSLGAHVSKIRSLTLDSFNTRESMDLLKYVSNYYVNSLYEVDKPPLEPTATTAERTAYITEKYADRDQKRLGGSPSRLRVSLIKAIHLESIYLLQKCVAEGVLLSDSYWAQAYDDESLFQYSLKHYEGTKEHQIFTVTEFLVLNGMPVDDFTESPDLASKWSPAQLEYWKSKYQSHHCKNVQVSPQKIPEAVYSYIARSPTSPVVNSYKRWSIGSSPGSNYHFSPPIIGKRHLKFPKKPKKINQDE
ncbi:HCL662Wp [Eremothecium sinecaudum]|uniref:ADP-ribosylation factor GTPase-activating protein n=1 Tax=Eremothecium sinecaudum TaxID=45286 RepID=A0A120K1K3_9SACH|nr:HCL662Wp [Eremothecium sinecaudum]AMD19489.1 HCL662Wp [Eremothecium sinecaudum]